MMIEGAYEAVLKFFHDDFYRTVFMTFIIIICFFWTVWTLDKLRKKDEKNNH